MRQDRLFRSLLHERFVVTLRGGETFDGLLIDSDDKTLHMADAYALDAKTRAVVDGQLFVPRSEIVYIQKPGGTS